MLNFSKLILVYIYIIISVANANVISKNYSIIDSNVFLYPNAEMKSLVSRYKTRIKQMFYKGITFYTSKAYPRDQIAPISCKGIDSWGQQQLTLVDSLDMFLFLGDEEGFQKAIISISSTLDFSNSTHHTNVFEANIRYLGSFLASHLLAIEVLGSKYDGSLLRLAKELGNKLILAFDSPTGLPYTKIRLKFGPVKGDRGYNTVCTAAATTFLLEFSWLSILTGDAKYETAGREALRQIWQMRSSYNLVSETANVDIGEWESEVSGLGSNIDSFYEYSLKAFLAFGPEQEAGDIFITSYYAVKNHLIYGNWPFQASMDTGELQPLLSVHSLASFFPSLQIMIGDLVAAKETISNYLDVLNSMVFLPEVTLIDRRFGYIAKLPYYIQRPELIESLYYLYRVTRDNRIFQWVFSLVDRIDMILDADCGFASLESVDSLRRSDSMESFMLSETLKYLYLILDFDNSFNDVRYIFNTEAHPFPVYSKAFPSKRNSTVSWKKYKSTKQCLDELQQARIRNKGGPFALKGFSRKLCPPENGLSYPASAFQLDTNCISSSSPLCRDEKIHYFITKKQCKSPSLLELLKISTIDAPRPRFFIKKNSDNVFI